MCTFRRYKSENCSHSWLKIKEPCHPGKGFTTCVRFRPNCPAYNDFPSKTYWADIDDCPWHGLKGNYDGNQIRVIDKIRPRCVVM